MGAAELDLRVARLAAAAAFYGIRIPWAILEKDSAAKVGERILALCAISEDELIEICSAIFDEEWDER